MSNLLERMDDLIKQATEEKSHHYVKSVLEEARGVLELFQCPKCKNGENFILAKDLPSFIKADREEVIEKIEGMRKPLNQSGDRRWTYNQALDDIIKSLGE